MLKLGQNNTLKVVEIESQGAWLDADDFGELLLLRHELPEQLDVGSDVEVFLYLNADAEPIVTTRRPLAQVGEFAWLNAVAVNQIGAFLDWGMPGDLFVPQREQPVPLKAHSRYLVYLMLDNRQRMMATTRLSSHIQPVPANTYAVNQAVTVQAWSKTPLGFNVLVDWRYGGLVYHNELFSRLPLGKPHQAWVKTVRTDGKLDISLYRLGQGKVEDSAGKIIATLQAKGGFLPVSDKSDPQLIAQLFGTSKGTFKKTIGTLYKQGLIRITTEGIYSDQKE